MNMLREALRLGMVVALISWVAKDLPIAAFLLATGVVPGLWWSSAAWDPDDVDLRAAVPVVVLAGLPVAVLLGADHALLVTFALWIGAALARVRLRPARVHTLAVEEWARRNAHRYGPGRADRPFPDTTSSDPYAPLYGWRSRPVPPPPLEVPPEHVLHIGKERSP